MRFGFGNLAICRGRCELSIQEPFIAEELLRLGWTEKDLTARLKNDPGKLAVAARVRKETTLSIKWIAARLQLGTSKRARAMLHHWMQNHEKPPKPTTCAQLQFQPMVDPLSWP
jgi:hypothetical protein